MSTPDPPVPAHQPVGLITRVGRAADWSGDQRIALAAPHLGQHFSAADYAEAFRALCLEPHARRAARDDIFENETPAFFLGRDGHVRCINRHAETGLEIIDNHARAAVVDVAAGVRRHGHPRDTP